MTEPQTPRSVQLMQNTLASLLGKEDQDSQELIELLQGYGLPPVGHDDEPYLWILRGLPETEAGRTVKAQLLQRVAALLEKKPDARRFGDQPEKLRYNLFLLCAGLHSPDQLADPLWKIFERGRLKGRFLDLDLRVPLRSALIMNQRDARLREVWERMAEGKEHSLLPGDEFDALEGARFMPKSEQTDEEPDLDLLGKAFKGVAQRLEEDPTRRRDLRYLINRVIDTYPKRSTWDWDLIQQAKKNQWPGWALECLPKLCIRLSPARGREEERALLWHYIAACIPKTYKHEVVEPSFYKDHIIEVKMSKEAALFVWRIAPVFEERRISNIYPSERAAVGVVTAALSDLEEEAHQKGEAEEARTFIEVRKQILLTKGVADLSAIGKALHIIAMDRLPENDRRTQFLSFVEAIEKLYPTEDVRKKILVNVKNIPWAKESLKLQS